MALSAPTSSSFPQIQPQPTPCFQPLTSDAPVCAAEKWAPANQPIATRDGITSHSKRENLMLAPSNRIWPQMNADDGYSKSPVQSMSSVHSAADATDFRVWLVPVQQAAWPKP